MILLLVGGVDEGNYSTIDIGHSCTVACAVCMKPLEVVPVVNSSTTYILSLTLLGIGSISCQCSQITITPVDLSFVGLCEVSLYCKLA